MPSIRRLALALVLLGGSGPFLSAQEPLFTFVQVSDSQPDSTAENQAFVDVLRTIAEAGQAGSLLPRRVDLVLFAGDITWGNTRSEWTAATQKLNTWLTANGIPYLAVPGNHDTDNDDTSLYEEFIADSGVWDAGSAAFTGQNGPSRTTGWRGLRFIGVNNSNPGWNTIPSADVAAVSARVDAAQSAQENAFILCHHPHNDKSRMPLSGVLPRSNLVGYLHGHIEGPSITRGLASVNNPNVYDCNTNAIYRDRCLIYFEVYQTQLKARLLVLEDNPTSLPAGTTIPLVFPLVQSGGGPPPPPPPPSNRFVTVADTRVSQGSPTSAAGSATTLRLRTTSSGSYQSFLRFDLGTLSGSVTGAKLRLWCSDASTAGGSVYRITSTTWSESALTWNTRPALPAGPLATYGAVIANAWNEIELGPTAASSGLVSLAIAGGGSNQADYSSREGGHPPELVLTLGTAPPIAPTADFSATPTSGAAPLSVAFTDTSSGSPTSWSWSFGDGGSSTQRNPTHVFGTPGTYTVTLAVANATGGDSVTRTDLVHVGSVGPVQTFLPIADARVNEASPSSNAGKDVVLRVRQESGGSYHTYLRFDLAPLAGASIVSARLRMFVTDGSDVAGRVFPTTGSWTETGITWSNKPGPSGTLITSTGTVANNAWAEFDVTSAVTSGGQLDLVLQSSSTNSCYSSSREGAAPPQLVVTTATP